MILVSKKLADQQLQQIRTFPLRCPSCSFCLQLLAAACRSKSCQVCKAARSITNPQQHAAARFRAAYRPETCCALEELKEEASTPPCQAQQLGSCCILPRRTRFSFQLRHWQRPYRLAQRVRAVDCRCRARISSVSSCKSSN